MKNTLLLCFVVLCSQVSAQKSLLQSGPMLGYSEMREVLLWAQTTESATIQFAYWPKGEKKKRQLTDTYTTTKTEAFVAKLIADEVEPGTTYNYELLINNKSVPVPYTTEFQTQALWQYRTDPPTFTMALGSCAYMSEEAYDRPGKPYGGDYTIFSTIQSMQPDAMLWLGDNIYLREVDWYTNTGIQKRYTHSRSLPELQPLLASTHHYAIWDDHDFGPNDSDGSFIHKDKTLDAFQLFWGNPTYGVNRQAGITTAFKWVDMDFFLIDNRYFRTPNHRTSGEQAIIGTQQLEWLIDALATSRAPFKFIAIGGQVLNTAEVYENHINLAPEERAYLLSRIAQENIKGVIFLSGDRHHTEMSTYTNANGHDVYDLTISPLTSGAARKVTEENRLLVEGTRVTARNFSIITVSGPRKERNLLIQVFDSNGTELWQRNIKAAQ